MRIFEMFAGYGTASFALKQLGIPYECVGYSDIDKYANQCFAQNHSGKELGDATKINPNDLEDFDLLTGGFPCQAFSIAGKGLGELDTRGTLFNEIIRIAEVKKPRYMLLENVKGLTNKNHRGTLIKIMNELHRIGYFVKTRILNTKEHGIPQNRERIFFVCFKNKDEWEKFEFPEKEELKLRLKDILEEKVDEKYYLSEKQIERLVSKERSFKERFQGKEVCGALCARDYKDPKCIQEPQIYDAYNKKLKQDGTCPTLSDPCHNNLRLVEPKIKQIGNAFKHKNRNNPQAGRIYDSNGISPSLNCMQGGNLQPFITEPKMITLDKEGNKIKNTPDIGQAKRIYSPKGISPALNNWSPRTLQDFRIRKLTPKECFRLQGFLNDEIILDGLSNTQKYKLAGNGQSVNVVKKIFERMFPQELRDRETSRNQTQRKKDSPDGSNTDYLETRNKPWEDKKPEHKQGKIQRVPNSEELWTITLRPLGVLFAEV
ncbi:hypothetical protein DRJ16_04940 [Candidatus Woesearchaeota archaeon]|nr:MAG: hypothetical protein DRJ16_04940 [Candidatus Woesearchaeota archaeon]